MITLNDLTMTYGPKLLFDGVTLNLTPKNRYGIVGANGAGKTTLLRLLMVQEEAMMGEITVSNASRIGWMRQDQFLYENERIIDVVMRGKPKLWDALQYKQKLLDDDVWNDETIEAIANVEETIGQEDGYTAEAFAHTLLSGLGIPNDKHLEPLNILSGGYKLRVLLAQTLFDNPDVLLLDEPTNHLDIATIGWLETYLKNQYKGLLVFISHDQNFLNTVSTHILDIDYGIITAYTGNYDNFEKSKALIAEQTEKERAGLEARIAHMQKFVDRFKAKASKATQAASKQKMIDKIELPDLKNSSRRSPHYQFDIKRPSGKKVLSVEDIAKSFGDKQVLKNVSFDIHRGEKVAFIGHNGIGKSTLLKILNGIYTPDCGSYDWGHETHISYFAQDHHEDLENGKTPFTWLEEKFMQKTSQELRKALGQMLFSKDDVDKQIESLSGGEAARLLFARIILERNNVLILDEPTNHLDMEAINGLAKALKKYQGTLLFVSHDRHFVSKIATRIIALTESGIVDFKGSYREYLKKFGDDYLSQQWLKQNA